MLNVIAQGKGKYYTAYKKIKKEMKINKKKDYEINKMQLFIYYLN